MGLARSYFVNYHWRCSMDFDDVMAELEQLAEETEELNFEDE